MKPAVAYETQEEHALELGGTLVRFVVKRHPRRRAIGLRVDQNGLAVLVPRRCAAWRIEAAVRDQGHWVLEKLAVWTAKRVPPPRWVHGELLPYRGAHAMLHVVASRDVRQFELALDTTPRIEVPAPGARAEAAAIAWYRDRASTHFDARVAHFAALLGVPTPRMLVSSARTRWGSCSADGTIRLTWRLVKATDAEIDYVVAHEIAHLRHMNHGRQFWATVGELYPNYRTASGSLDRNDLRYRTF